MGAGFGVGTVAQLSAGASIKRVCLSVTLQEEARLNLRRG